jgi:hypothetical protein
LPEKSEAQMKGWWSNTVAVLDRVRDKMGELETTQGEKGDKGEKGESGSAATAGELKATLSIEGDAVGTLNTQELHNATIDGGSF